MYEFPEDATKSQVKKQVIFLTEKIRELEKKYAEVMKILDRRRGEFHMPPDPIMTHRFTTNTDLPPSSNSYTDDDTPPGTIAEYSDTAVRIKQKHGWELITKERLEEHFKIKKYPKEYLTHYLQLTKPHEEETRETPTE